MPDPMDTPIRYPVTLHVWSHEEHSTSAVVVDAGHPMAEPEGRPLRALVDGFEDNADRVVMALDRQGSLLFHRDLPGLSLGGDAADLVDALLEAAGDLAHSGLRERALGLAAALRHPTDTSAPTLPPLGPGIR